MAITINQLSRQTANIETGIPTLLDTVDIPSEDSGCPDFKAAALYMAAAEAVHYFRTGCGQDRHWDWQVLIFGERIQHDSHMFEVDYSHADLLDAIEELGLSRSEAQRSFE